MSTRAALEISISDLRRWSNTYDHGPTMRTTELWLDAEHIDRRIDISVVDAPELDGVYVVDEAANGLLRLTTMEPCL